MGLINFGTSEGGGGAQGSETRTPPEFFSNPDPDCMQIFRRENLGRVPRVLVSQNGNYSGLSEEVLKPFRKTDKQLEAELENVFADKKRVHSGITI